MSANSKIEWTDHTFNPWIGCTKVSPGCANCYAEARDDRFAGGKHWGKGAPRQRTSASNWRLPLKWNQAAICANCGYDELIGSDDCRRCGSNFDPATRRRPRVFCASLADWLDPEVPIEWLADLLALIKATPNLDWLLLTKRPENCHVRLLEVGMFMVGYRDGQTSSAPTVAPYPNEETAEWVNAWTLGSEAPRNVWLGVSVEDQKRADERREVFESTPAIVKFVSYEPALKNVDWSGWEFVDQIIFGGESGPVSRVCNVRWGQNTLAFCRAHGIKFFCKQLGANAWIDWEELKLRHRKGGDPSEWPEDLRIREFPVVEAAVSAADDSIAREDTRHYTV